MPRALRVQAPGTYHLFAHSVSGRPLFGDSHLRRRFLHLLGAAAERYAWHVQMYCLLTTHYHLLVRIDEPNLARGMQWLNGIYGAAVNAIERDRGHVFGSRYDSRAVTTDAYLLEVIRYIALNPVRAGLCTRLETRSILDADSLLGLFGRNRVHARRRLESFIRDGLVAVA